MTVDTAELNTLVRQQISAILGDPIARSALIGTSAFGPEQQDQLEKHESQIQSLLADSSIGRALNGPLWLSGASVVNGTITADKISVNTLEAVTTNTGTLNVTGTITAATAYPATGARVEINSTGLVGYSGAVTTTFKLNTDGSGEIGTGANKITWNTGGAVAIPAALITLLTIASVTSGNFGGTYASGSSNPKFQLSSTSLVAFDASGNETFKILASTGAVTATGSFTVQSATSGARVVLSNAGGIEGYNSGSTRTFFVNAASGAGQMGAGTNSMSWDSSGNVSIGGVALSSGKITASHLSVSTLSAISANLGTVTAGTINASLVTVSNLTATNISSGALGSGGSGINIGGTNGLGINGNLTLGSGGKIVDADGSYWDQTGIVLKSSGSFGDCIKWQLSSTDKGSITAASTIFGVTSASGVTMQVGSQGAGTPVTLVAGGDIIADVGDGSGTYAFRVRTPSTATNFLVASNGAVGIRADATYGIATGYTTLGSLTGRWAIYNSSGSLVGYIPVYTSIT